MGEPFPGNWSFKHHPWTREMHDSKAELNVSMKGAQLGITETMLNISFFRIDIHKHSVLYILPASKPHAANFSKSRFDPALELSKHIASMFSDVDNVDHKRSGAASLFIRGSASRIGLKSDPTAVVIMDEQEEMVQKNIDLAMARNSGQKEKDRLIWMLSTPRFKNRGIHAFYTKTTQEHFFFKCPACSRMTEFTFPECLVVCGDDENDPRVSESYIRCKECLNKLPDMDKFNYLDTGIWVPTSGCEKREARGWHVSQLYSSVISAKKLAIAKHKADYDPVAEIEFYNSMLGLPHETEGARVKLENYMASKTGYRMYEDIRQVETSGIVTMGVDVGTDLHIEITQYDPSACHSGADINSKAKAKVLRLVCDPDFDILPMLMDHFAVDMCVIDANPERRKAMEFATKFFGRVYCCFYGNSSNGKIIKVNEDEQTVTVDRTSWLDLSLGRFRYGTIQVPDDAERDHEKHIMSPIKTYVKTNDGNTVARYETEEGEDHYAHARNYNEIAFTLAFDMVESLDIVERVA